MNPPVSGWCARYKKVLIAAGILLCLGAVKVAMLPAVFRARVLVSLPSQSADGQNSGMSQPMFSHAYSPATEIARIQSKTVLGPAADSLGLATRWNDGMGAGLSRDEVLAKLRKKVSATARDGTSLIELCVSSHNPAESAEIANCIAETYVASVADSFRRARADIANLLRQNLAWQTTAVANLRKKIEQMQTANSVGSDAKTGFDTNSPANVRSYALAMELARVEANLIFAQSRWEELNNLDRMTLREVLPVILPNELVLSDLVAQLSALDSELERIQESTAPDSPEFASALQTRAEIEEQLEQRITALMAGMESELNALKTQQERLQSELEPAKPAATDVHGHAGAIAQLERELQARQKACDDIQFKILQEETDLASVRAVWVPQIVESAEPPTRPVRSYNAAAWALFSIGLITIVWCRLVGRFAGRTLQK